MLANYNYHVVYRCPDFIYHITGSLYSLTLFTSSHPAHLASDNNQSVFCMHNFAFNFFQIPHTVRAYNICLSVSDISLCIVPSSSIHVSNGKMFFFILAEKYSIVWVFVCNLLYLCIYTYHIFLHSFIQPWTFRLYPYLDCRSNAVMNMCVRVSR